MAPTDGILHAPALLPPPPPLLPPVRRQITRHRPTDGPPSRPTRSWPIGTTTTTAAAAAVASTRLDR